MATRPAINLDRINEGDSITVTKNYDGSGKVCSNQNVMFGVLHEGTEKSLFVHQDIDTKGVLEHLNSMPVNKSVKISSNRGGGYSIDGNAVVKSASPSYSNKDEDIKWGMAFNNATRLVMSEHEFDGDILKRVKMIEEIMPAMFKIAKMMPSVKKNTEDKLF